MMLDGPSVLPNWVCFSFDASADVHINTKILHFTYLKSSFLVFIYKNKYFIYK